MSQVKIQVIGADGKFRGSLFKDGPWHDLRWAGTPKPNLHEAMVCTRDPADGMWYLLEYVVPRQIVGEESRDSLFDEASTCRQMTPVQALHWFTLQPFGPPPELAAHVLRFTRDWREFCASPELQVLVDTLGKSLDTEERDPSLSDIRQSNIDLLVRLRLVYASDPTPTINYSVDNVARDMGVAGYITWMSAHISRIATWLDANAPKPPLTEGDRLSGLANGSWVDPAEKQNAVTAHGDGAILSRVAKALCAEVDSIHRLRLGRTSSKPWEDQLKAQLPADITSLRNAVSEADMALSKLQCEHHFSKDGLTTSFLAQFDGDHEAAILALPKLIEEAAAAKQAAAAALSERRVDEAKAENSLIEGWLATHREKLQAMRDEFAQPYERQLVELTQLHNGPVEVNPWRETSHCGVLLKIVDATLKLLNSARSRDKLMESDRLSRSFAHLTESEWEDLEMNIRSEAARVGASPPPVANDRANELARRISQQQKEWMDEQPPLEILEQLREQLPSAVARISESRTEWASLATQLAGMLALRNVDFAAKQLARILLSASGLRDVEIVVCNPWIKSGVSGDLRRAISAASQHAATLITQKDCDIAAAEAGLRTAAKVFADNPTSDPPQISDPQPAHENRFISKGKNTWEVSFEGGPELFLNGKGAAYLHHLIRHEHKPVRATELQAIVAGHNESLLLGNAGEATDDIAREDYKQQYHDLEKEKEKASQNSDQAELARINKEQAQLLAHTQNDIGLHGRARLTHGNEEKARKAVRAAITRTIEKIRQDDRALADHLQQPTLQLGGTLTYSPTPAIRWAL
mgnify:CR=1 FL=1